MKHMTTTTDDVRLVFQTWELLFLKLISKTVDDSMLQLEAKYDNEQVASPQQQQPEQDENQPPATITSRHDTAWMKNLLKSYLPIVPDGTKLNSIPIHHRGIQYSYPPMDQFPQRGDSISFSVQYPFQASSTTPIWIFHNDALSWNRHCVVDLSTIGIVQCQFDQNVLPKEPSLEDEDDTNGFQSIDGERIDLTVTVIQSISFQDFPKYFHHQQPPRASNLTTTTTTINEHFLERFFQQLQYYHLYDTKWFTNCKCLSWNAMKQDHRHYDEDCYFIRTTTSKEFDNNIWYCITNRSLGTWRKKHTNNGQSHWSKEETFYVTCVPMKPHQMARLKL